MLALDAAGQGKRDRYGALCLEAGIELHAMAMDSLHSIRRSVELGLQFIVEFIAIKRGTSPSSERVKALHQAQLPRLANCCPGD